MNALLKIGSQVFYNHPNDSWIVGSIVSIDEVKKTYTCRPRENNFTEATVDEEGIYLMKDEALTNETSDLLEMTELHEATLLRCVYNRFRKDLIYTFIGPLILSMNPFKWTIPWVQEDQMIKYITQRPHLLPHAWSIADTAFRLMKENKGNQSILVSGESGAGKTEAVKTVIKYLSKLTCHMTTNETVKENAIKISTRIQESSPILEAFGNAKTINNDNSSRFGKFIKLQYDNHGIIQGALVIQYLLEKSRLIIPGPNERSYHIFYQLVAGASDQERREWHLTKAEDFDSLVRGNCVKVDGVDDAADYKVVRNAMDIVGMEPGEQEAILRLCAAILHLLNIKFANNDKDFSYVVDDKPLLIGAKLLKVDPDYLRKVLVMKRTIFKDGAIDSELNMNQASDARDALVKALYSKTFDWIVWKINETTKAQHFDRYIGLLDIFGFEKFEKNSFEQFCINYANETLQNHYNNYTFKRDMAECEAEGIDSTSVKFNDNQDCIEMIQGKMGIISVLDEQCAFPKATDYTFLEKIRLAFDKKTPYFSKHPLKREEFMVTHYAGVVSYNIIDWLEKNKDRLKDDMIDLLLTSQCKFISSLIPKQDDENVGSGRRLTVAGSFRQQLLDLMKVINSTQPYWIRCIKPHPAKKPGMFSNFETMKQLRSSGVLETIRIRREGYCVRMPLKDFFARYKVISGEAGSDNLKASCKKIVDIAKFDSYKAQIGVTKVFMRSQAYNELEDLRNKALAGRVLVLQKFARVCVAKIRLWKLREEKRLQLEKVEYEKNKEIFERLEKERKEAERLAQIRKQREEEDRKRAEEEIRKIEQEMRQQRERELREAMEKERIRREKEETIEKYAVIKKVREEKLKELEVLEQCRQKRLDEHQKIKDEISRLETGQVYEPAEPTEPMEWRIGRNGHFMNFNLTDARRDLIYRLKTNQLYTMEGCKLLIKEIVKVMRDAAEIDLKNLMMLSEFRTELLFPLPIQSNFLGPNHGVEGFLSDSPEVKALIYGPDLYDIETLPKNKLQHIMFETNISLVKMIDTALRQRKERLLLSATIMSEMESNYDVLKAKEHVNF